MRPLNHYLPVAAFVLLLAIAGCKKDDKTTTDVSAEFKSGLQQLNAKYNPAPQVVTVSANNGGQIIGGNTRVVFYPGAFITANGTAVTGNVQVEFREIYKKGHMVLSNKLPVSPQGLLDSRGEVYINATQNGQQLRLRQGYAAIQFEGRNYNDPMNLFMATDSSSGDLSWNQVTVTPDNPGFTCSYDSMNPPVYIDTATVSDICDTLYTFPLDGLGWINCDYFMNQQYGALTTVTANVPAGYTADNTVTYVVFTTVNSAAKFWYDANTTAFTLGGGYQVPIGLQATIVSLSYQQDGWYSAIQPVTFTANHTLTLTYAPTTIADYEAAVNAL